MLDDRLAFFIGAGISASEAGLPTASGLAHVLASQLGISDHDKKLASLASEFESSRDRVELFNVIKSSLAFEGDLTDPKICPSYKLLAQLPLKTIITTNFDNLVESAFESERVDLRVYARDKLMSNFYPAKRKLLKIHGDLSCAPDELVITEEDYASYAKYYPLFSDHLKHILETHAVVFIGYSLGDSNFEYIYDNVFTNLRNLKLKSYAVMRSEPNSHVKEQWLNKKVQILAGNAEDLLRELVKRYKLETAKLSPNKTSTKVVRGHSLRRPNFGLPSSPTSIRKAFAYFVGLRKNVLVMQQYGYCVLDTFQSATTTPAKAGKISGEVSEKAQEIAQKLTNIGYHSEVLDPLDSSSITERGRRIENANFCVLMISSLTYEPVLNRLYGPIALQKPIILIVHENLQNRTQVDMVFQGLVHCGANLTLFARKDLLSSNVWKRLSSTLENARDEWLARLIKGAGRVKPQEGQAASLLGFASLLTLTVLIKYRRVSEPKLCEVLGMSGGELKSHLLLLKRLSLIGSRESLFEIKPLGRRIAAVLELYRFDLASSKTAYSRVAGSVSDRGVWNNSRVYVPKSVLK